MSVNYNTQQPTYGLNPASPAGREKILAVWQGQLLNMIQPSVAEALDRVHLFAEKAGEEVDCTNEAAEVALVWCSTYAHVGVGAWEKIEKAEEPEWLDPEQQALLRAILALYKIDNP